MRPLLSLVMIVKNEAASIKPVLEAVRPYIDRWTILDTGSTDGTVGIICETLKDIPGHVSMGPFENFSSARNRVMAYDLLGKDVTEFQIMLSGDEYLRGGQKLRDYLEKHRDSKIDCHFIRLFLADKTIPTPRIFRTGSNWKYEGVIHEIPVNRVDENAHTELAPDCSIDHIVTDEEARAESVRANHIPLLWKEFEKDPENARTLIFLAQSYEELIPLYDGEEREQLAEVALSLYAKRLTLPCETADEHNYVWMRKVDVARETGWFTAKELYDEADLLCQADPHRPEAALIRANLAQTVLPAVKVYHLAAQAAEVAERMNAAIKESRLSTTSPIDTSCCWKAHHLAAVCANQLSQRHSEEEARNHYAALRQKHTDAGLEAGGNWLAFQVITSPAMQNGAFPADVGFSPPEIPKAPQITF